MLDISKKLKLLHRNQNLSSSFEFMYSEMGVGTLTDSHKFLMINMNREDCTQVRFEEFTTDFDRAAEKWLNAWGISSQNVLSEVLNSMRRHDLKRKTAAELAREHHISGKSLTREDMKEIENIILNDSQRVAMLSRQAEDLGYKFL